MIKKIGVILLIQIILYSLFVSTVDLSWIKRQSFEQSNLIKSEKYLYEEQNIENRSAIIGTSLSAVLDKTDLPDEFVNIAFHGMSVLDGFKLINSSPQKPEKVFVEMNMILLAIFDEDYKDLQTPYSYYPKKYLPILRQKARPVELITSSFFEFAPNFYRTITGQPTIESDEEVEVENFLKASQVEKKKVELSTTARAGLVDTCFQRLAVEMQALEQTGTCIIFYEVPLEEGLCGLTQSNQIRDRFYKEYPRTKYQYISQPSCEGYRTSDGLHMTLKSAKKFTSYFLEQVKKLKC